MGRWEISWGMDEKVKICVLAAGGEGKGNVMGDELGTEWEGEHDMPHLKGCRWGREWDIIGCGGCVMFVEGRWKE